MLITKQEGAFLSRLAGIARGGDVEALGEAWLDALQEGFDPVDAGRALEAFVAAGLEEAAASLLEIALDELESSGSPALDPLVRMSAEIFGVMEPLRLRLVESLRDGFLDFAPLEGFLVRSGLLEAGGSVAPAWGRMKRLLGYREGCWVLHDSRGPGLVRRASRESFVVDFAEAHSFEMPLATMLDTCEPVSPDSAWVLRRTDPGAFSALPGDPGRFLDRLLEDMGGSVDRSSLAKLLGHDDQAVWKALSEAAHDRQDLAAGPGLIERIAGAGLEDRVRSILSEKRPLSERVSRMADLMAAAPREEASAAANSIAGSPPRLRSVEEGAAWELLRTLRSFGAEGLDGRLEESAAGMTAPRLVQALSEISRPSCRRDLLEAWAARADEGALEGVLPQLSSSMRSMALEALEKVRPGRAAEWLARTAADGSDPDLALWAAAAILEGGPGGGSADIGEIVRFVLENLPRARAEQQRRASRAVVSHAAAELDSLLSQMDARRLSSVAVQIDESGPAHEAGLVLAISREISSRSSHILGSLQFWESDYVFDGAAAIERRAAAIERLRTVEIPEAAASVGEAASHGDLSENAEYKAALERRDLLLEKLSRWSEEYRRLRPLPWRDIRGDVASPGTAVEMSGAGGSMRIVLVGPLEARPEEGRVNYMAPLGAALLGRSAGESVDLPGREGSWRIERIEPVPEVFDR